MIFFLLVQISVIVLTCEGLLYILKKNGDAAKENQITVTHLEYNIYCLRLIELFAGSIYFIIILRNDMGIRFDRSKRCLNLFFHYFLVFIRFCIILFIFICLFPILAYVIYFSFKMIQPNSLLYENSFTYDKADTFNLVFCWLFWMSNISAMVLIFLSSFLIICVFY